MTSTASPAIDYLTADTVPRSTPRPPDDLLRVTFPQAIARQAAVIGDRELLVDGERRLTYGEFATRMTVAARALMAVGLQVGDRVAVWAPNSVEWLITALGASAAGAAVMPMNSRFKGAEAAEVIRRGRPRVLFTMGDFLGNDYARMLRDAAADGDLDGVRIVALDGRAGPEDLSLEDFLALGRDVEEADAVERRESISPDDVSDIILTSGTTGHPKGVMTSHYQNVLAWVRYAKHFQLRQGERINATLPFFHNFGLKAGFLVPVLIGGTCISEAVYDPAKLAGLVESERITFLKGTPALFNGLLSSAARHERDLSSLRLCLVAGAMIAEELVARMKSDLCQQVVAGYGMSELCAGIALTPIGADAERVSRWAGQLVEGVEIRIVDEDGTDLPRGEAGRILVRGECVMLGYADDAQAGADAVDADGWLHTGDVGLVDDENFVRVTDRVKDMFLVGGFNAYPAEIERLMLMHPDIDQVAVVGMPDERLGEVGAAFVVARRGVDLDAQQVLEWARGAMANYKVPRRVDVLEQLPVNASMKVLKHELRARLALE